MSDLTQCCNCGHPRFHHNYTTPDSPCGSCACAKFLPELRSPTSALLIPCACGHELGRHDTSAERVPCRDCKCTEYTQPPTSALLCKCGHTWSGHTPHETTVGLRMGCEHCECTRYRPVAAELRSARDTCPCGHKIDDHLDDVEITCTHAGCPCKRGRCARCGFLRSQHESITIARSAAACDQFVTVDTRPNRKVSNCCSCGHARADHQPESQMCMRCECLRYVDTAYRTQTLDDKPLLSAQSRGEFFQLPDPHDVVPPKPDSVTVPVSTNVLLRWNVNTAEPAELRAYQHVMDTGGIVSGALVQLPQYPDTWWRVVSISKQLHKSLEQSTSWLAQIDFTRVILHTTLPQPFPQ